MKLNKVFLLLLVASVSGFSIEVKASSEDIEDVTTAIFSGVENCRTRSLLVRQVADAKDRGISQEQLISIAGSDQSLHEIVRQTYASDQPALEQSDNFLVTCLEDVRAQIARI
ncbi:hypothetical protein [Halomonas phage vB_HmeY_H4907]|nr:hypothetical protein [Halomonas phage vB_HmeY_H4907]